MNNLISGTVSVPRELLEQAIRRDYPKPRLDGNYCCVSCGRWMPHDHDEPHDHLEGCAEEKAAAAAHWPNCLRAILAQPAEQQDEPVEYQYRERPCWVEGNLFSPWAPCDKGFHDSVLKDPLKLNFQREARALYIRPAAQAVKLHPFAAMAIAKLARFRDCAEDNQGADIGRKWFDTLVQLGLLERVQRSPALWEITDQGEEVLEFSKLNGIDT